MDIYLCSRVTSVGFQMFVCFFLREVVGFFNVDAVLG